MGRKGKGKREEERRKKGGRREEGEDEQREKLGGRSPSSAKFVSTISFPCRR